MWIFGIATSSRYKHYLAVAFTSSCGISRFLFLFFFQAEDGIRDGHVTGVQTCALPICARPGPSGRRPSGAPGLFARQRDPDTDRALVRPPARRALSETALLDGQERGPGGDRKSVV